MQKFIERWCAFCKTTKFLQTFNEFKRRGIKRDLRRNRIAADG